jgi:hypothetical protein
MWSWVGDREVSSTDCGLADDGLRGFVPALDAVLAELGASFETSRIGDGE